jgi:hypothetical protein
MKNILIPFLSVVLFASCGQSSTSSTPTTASDVAISPDSARAIAKEAWIYGYPMFYNYKSIYLYALDKNYPDNAGGFNRFKHYAKMFTDKDTSIVTPNDDTPYSWGMLDLSDEPVVLVLPAMPDKRYYVMQLIDLYTFNFAYAGARTTGTKAGKYLIARTDWKGDKPAGIDSVFHCETNIVTILGRTELKGEADMGNVKSIQSKYQLIPLHQFAKQPAPAHKQYAMPLPEWKEGDYMNISFINVLNALLQYTTVDPGEDILRERFAKIGIVPGKPFDSSAYSKEVLAAINEGIKDGEAALKASVDKTTSSMNLFGTRENLQNDYVTRATAAAMGLFGNTKEEAVYVGSLKDKEGNMLMGGQKYVLHFSRQQIPQVKYFWSTTVYNLPKRFLAANPINRYSIGDRTKGLKYNADGSLDIYLQSTSPGKDKENNWLPVPAQGPFNYVIRLYGPSEAVTNGTWQQPLPEKVQ